MGGEFQAIRPVKGTHHNLCQEYILLYKHQISAFLLIISSGCGNDRNLHISSQVYKMHCNYCFLLVESAMKATK